MTDAIRGRADSAAGRLARLGVVDAERLAAGVAGLPWWDDRLLEDVGDAADPSQVLRTALELDEVDRAGIEAVAGSRWAWRRYSMVTGVSQALADHLVRHPEHLPILLEDTPPPHGEDLRDAFVAIGDSAGTAAADPLRLAHKASVLRIAISDLAHAAPFELTAARLSELADAVLDGALAAARAALPADAPASGWRSSGWASAGGAS